MSMLRLVVLCLLCAHAISLPSYAAAADQPKQWRFKVLLDGKPIGHHYFTLADNNGRRDLTSEARFNVKLLFVTVYRYVHDSHEMFQGDCLEKIEARTNDNGSDLIVKGTLEPKGFVVTSHKTEHPACIMTFAYWNPNMLSQTQLLNSQNGKYEPVTIKKVGSENARSPWQGDAGRTLLSVRRQAEDRSLVFPRQRVARTQIDDGRWTCAELSARMTLCDTRA